MNFGLFIVSKWIENVFSSSDFPLIMTPKFWTYLYRKVADDRDKRNERIKFSKNINDCFEEFDSTRRSPEIKEYLYNIPVLDRLHDAFGFEWARKVELKNREAAGIQQVYSEIPTVDSVNSSELLKYLRAVGRN
ncbi:hypothetical protein RMATCC62417_04918 [Rhizopus microsporus]|nr:hypothetical protein RMATCC62417_04918 [Rhizopus microsporus]